MVLNYIWIAFFLVAFVIGLARLVFMGDTEVFPAMMNSTFSSAKTAFEISLGLTGVLSLWLGVMKIGEKGGVVNALARVLSPVFTKLFPDIPKGHPATGSIFMNIAANMLGLDNAATPLGLKAMEQLQSLNVPRAQHLRTYHHTRVDTRLPRAARRGTAYRRIHTHTDSHVLLDPCRRDSDQPVPAHQPAEPHHAAHARRHEPRRGGDNMALRLDGQGMNLVSTTAANILLMCVIVGFIVAGMRKRVNVYDAFIEGAKDGFTTAVRIIPYLVAILVGIGVFRASGAMDAIVDGIKWLVELCGGDTEFVGALPTALMKPLSGSGARGMMVDAMSTYGADSFVGRLSCIFQGSTDTTFYILAVYFGSVGVRYTRHAVACGLLADLAGVIAAIAVCYLFF